jgi:hypothetical protein
MVRYRVRFSGGYHRSMAGGDTHRPAHFLSIDTDWVNLIAVIVGLFAAFRMFRRIT